jgi:hypothetical protein
MCHVLTSMYLGVVYIMNRSEWGLATWCLGS